MKKAQQKENEMKNETKNSGSMALPALAHEGGTKAMTLTPVVGRPRQKYAEVFIPGEEALATPR